MSGFGLNPLSAPRVGRLSASMAFFILFTASGICPVCSTWMNSPLVAFAIRWRFSMFRRLLAERIHVEPLE